MDKKLGLLFPVTDEDERHFDRFHAELRRLGLPFAVHLDHCSRRTANRFRADPLCIGYHWDQDERSFFDESFRQHAMDVLIKEGFEFALQMDVDETLEPRAPEKIQVILDLDVDVVDVRVLDLWGDGDHYRVDGPFAGSHREKFFKLRGNVVKYPHPTSHAPNVERPDKAGVKVVKNWPFYVLHWGIMSVEDAWVHKRRWDAIYTRKCGANPYGGYNYMVDPDYPPVCYLVADALKHERHVPPGQGEVP